MTTTFVEPLPIVLCQTISPPDASASCLCRQVGSETFAKSIDDSESCQPATRNPSDALGYRLRHSKSRLMQVDYVFSAAAKTSLQAATPLIAAATPTYG